MKERNSAKMRFPARAALPKLGIRKKLKQVRLSLTSPRMVSMFSMPDEVFLAKFDRENVTGALNHVGVSLAIELLLAYYQQRRSPGWPEFPLRPACSKYNPLELSEDEVCYLAEEVLRHRFSFLNLPTVNLGERIDWFLNPSDDQKPRWTMHLHWHGWWSILAQAYNQTGDERYAQEFVDTMLIWVRTCPPPVHPNEMHVAWNLMGTGIRSLNWLAAFGTFFASPTFTSEAKVIMLRSIYDHANFLALFKTNRNHLLRESLGFAHIAIYFPEFIFARSWLKIALQRFERELTVQINEDGSQIEMSTGYQWEVIEEYEDLQTLLQDNDLSLSHQDLSFWIEKMYHFIAYVTRPDGHFPDLNDGFIRSNDRSLRKLVSTGTSLDRSDFVSIGTRGRDGSLPKHTSIAFENAGLYIMRSDWEQNARYLLFDAGPYGGSHGHEDKLHIEVYAFRQAFIVDSGSYTYNRDDPYRTYFVGSHGHNTVLVDGLSQVRRWQENNLKPMNNTISDAIWLSPPEFDFVSASFKDGYGNVPLRRKYLNKDSIKFRDVCHTRQVRFVKPDYWIVVDCLEASAPHNYEVLFHAATGIEVSTGFQNRVILQSPSGRACLLLVPVLPEAVNLECLTGTETPIQGWHSAIRSNKEQATTIIFKQEKQVSTVMTTLLFPTISHQERKLDSPNVEIKPLDVENGTGLAFLMTTDTYKDYLLISANNALKHFGAF